MIAAPLLAAVVAAANPVVTFDIKPGGDVKWKGAPSGCTVDFFLATGTDAVVKDADATKGFSELEPGTYDAVVACDSDEGLVKKTVPVVLKDRDVAVPVSLEPGFLLVNVLRHDTPIAAIVTIFDERGREMAESKDKAVIPLVPGKVRVLAKVNDDRTSRVVFGNAQAAIVTKQKATAQVDTTDGSLVVNITDNGRKAGGVAALRQPGTKTRLIELHAGEKGDAPPGSYDLVTQLDDTHDFSELVTKNVVIAPGKPTTKTVNHSTALIKPTVLVDGKKPPAEAKIDVELSTPGATSGPFNTAAVGDALKVAAGTFEIAAVRKDASFDDGTPPKATQKITVHGGEVRGLTLDISAGHLDVTTTVGGKPKALDVELDAPGNDVPLGRRTTDAIDGKTSFALSAGKYIVKAVLHAPQGDVVTTHDASVAIGSHIGVKLNIDVGTAVVQVFEGGVAVPAEVRLFKAEAMKPRKSSKGEIVLEPTGDPVVSSSAGQELYVPPGVYAIVVVRRGEIHVFSDLKVAAGRNVDRTVEIK